jgi:transcriptional regulator with XRE-family HTH domain
MVGSRIKYFRELNNLKREWLAEQLGINASQVNRIENNQSEITIKRLYKISQLFNISILDLFEEKHLTRDVNIDSEKYSNVERSYIRFLIHQNELLKLDSQKLINTCDELLETIKEQQVQFKRLMDFVMHENTPERASGKMNKKP